MISMEEEPFLKGEENPLFLGLTAGAGIALILFLILLAATRRLGISLPIALVLGVVAFLGVRSFVSKNIPVKKPLLVNNRQGETFWEIAGRHGIRSTVIRVPATFPPDPAVNGRVLSGLGVPDIRGSIGTYSYYTSEIFKFGKGAEKGGKVIPVDVEQGTPRLKTFIYGPYNKLFDEPPEIHIPLELIFDWQKKTMRAVTSGNELELAVGEWSDWIPLTFPVNSIIKIQGITRFHLISMEPEFRLYMSAVNFDPQKPHFNITEPEGFARQIYDKVGYWKTLGWAIDTGALDEEVTEEDTFGEDMYFTVEGFERILRNFINDPADRLYVQIFYFTDRAGHMFWRLLNEDPSTGGPGTDHPAYDAELAARHGNFIHDAYKKMDEIVGWTLEQLPEDGVLLICSDHGFSAWKYSFNMNTWLWENGFLALKGDQDPNLKSLDDLFVEGEFWRNVDWDRTKAYAVGLGAIYINMLGREANGIVPPGDDYEEVRNEIITKMEAYVDPATGLHPINKVYKREEMYVDFDPELIPDLRATNNIQYRVSSQTSLGGVPRDMFEIHTDKWSGDHCSLDPQLVKGIFFSNWRAASGREPYIGDLCPTVLDLLEIPVPLGLVGRVYPLERDGLLGQSAQETKERLHSLPYLGGN
jgi:predicted AlkP superfamily phosphohydrolase/phosphomutase